MSTTATSGRLAVLAAWFTAAASVVRGVSATGAEAEVAAAAGPAAGAPGWRVVALADEWPPLEPLLEVLRREAGVATVDRLEPPVSATALAGCRAVFMYVHGVLDPPTVDALIACTRAGGRTIVLHHGLASAKLANPDWLAFLGVRIAPPDAPDRPWRVIAHTTHQLVDLCPEHAVSHRGVTWDGDVDYAPPGRGQSPQRLPALVFPDTEVFVNQQLLPGRPRTVLFGSVCTNPADGRVIVQDTGGWLEPAGAGWLMYIQVGHAAADFAKPALQRVLLNAVAWPPATPGPGAGQAAWAVSGVQRAEDTVEVSGSGADAVAVLVTSPGGIGRAQIAPRDGAWPRELRIRFRYDAGRPFTRLEGLACELRTAGAGDAKLMADLQPAAAEVEALVRLPAAVPPTAVLSLAWVDAHR